MVTTMTEYITKEQLSELEQAPIFGIQEFHKLLEEYTGIVAKSYTAYQYYDNSGNYIGDGETSSLRDLLDAAYVEVRDG